MARPMLLDLFCGAGGASAGLAAAGFQIVGVDWLAQPHYPFEFVRADVFDVAPALIRSGRFHALFGSPTCNDHSALRTTYAEAHGSAWQVPATRDLFRGSGLPYVIENVPRAPLLRPVLLCGSMFALGADCYDGYRQLRRHRAFESNLPLQAPGPCRHQGLAVGVYGGGPESRETKRARTRDISRGGYQGTVAERRQALGTPWMTQAECSLAIPPAYTEWIGRQLIHDLKAANPR